MTLPDARDEGGAVLGVAAGVRGVPRGTRPASAGSRVRSTVRAGGEVLITLGGVLLLFVVYEVYVTDLISAAKQREATVALDDRWSDPNRMSGPPLEGDGIAKLYVPALGADYSFTVLEGTGPDTLATGPGHYTDTAMPGQPGNFALAGHRVGKGAPFNDLDVLESCDALVVETRDTWFVYRVLPMREEIAGWGSGKAVEERCAGVEPLAEPYPQVPGREIVLPSQREVIAPVPGAPDLQLPTRQQEKLITLTTCHPKFSARQRLIIHGALVAQYVKDGGPPPELTIA